MSGNEAAATAEADEACENEPILDERDAEPRTPMKRLGSTRKIAAYNNIRVQLSAGARAVEARAEAAGGAAAELHEYCRRRAELEHEYARALDKLAKRGALAERVVAGAAWAAALDATRALARDHASLAELWGSALSARASRAERSARALGRRARDLLGARHDELAAALQHAAALGKRAAAADRHWRLRAGKLRAAQTARNAADDAPARLKKLKALDKDLDKRITREAAARSAALRARAEYVLALEGADAALQHHCLRDLPRLLHAVSGGAELAVVSAVRAAASADASRGSALQAAAAALAASAQPAAPPEPPLRPARLPYTHLDPAEQDAEMLALSREVGVILGEADAESETGGLAGSLRRRGAALAAAARGLRTELATHEAELILAEQALHQQILGEDEITETPVCEDKKELEDYYVAKLRSAVCVSGRLARLEARLRARHLAAPSHTTQDAMADENGSWPLEMANGIADADEPRLPRVLTECVRVIATYGIRQQGIFRVCGSAVEAAALAASFRSGADPLRASRASPADINAVCGVLKQYVRSARLVPGAVLTASSSTLPALLRALPPRKLLPLRYFASFLHHLTQYSEHNMMDAWNLAVCVGPALFADVNEQTFCGRDGAGAQVAHHNLVIEIVKRIIEQHAELFPQDIYPHTLYKPAPEAQLDSEDVPDAQSHDLTADLSQDASRDMTHDEADALSDEDENEISDDESVSDEEENDSWQEHDEVEAHNEESARLVPVSQEGAGEPPGAEAHPGAQSVESSLLAARHCRRLAETTPDLVLDLPARSSSPSVQPIPAATTATEATSQAVSPVTPDSERDSADTFLHNRDTLKKRPNRQVVADGPTTGNVAGVARVAAQFADLRLTGGSQPQASLAQTSPVPALKPALLRRPTPHPHAARNSNPTTTTAE